VGGGESNTASGDYATVPGGYFNVADGDYSFAAGRYAKAKHDGAFVWGDDTYADFASTDRDQFLIRASGGVGIGTNSPAFTLDVAGAANLNKGKGGAALWVSGAEAIWFDGTQFSWGFGGIWNYFSDSVCIGGPPVDPGTHKLLVRGSAAKPGGGSWSNYSDGRLKTISGNYEHGLSEITRLNPMTYRYAQGNDLELPTEKEYVGVVAQQVRNVIPEAVEENSDGYLMVNNDPVIWAMVNAIKELKAENDALKQRLEALEKTMGQHKRAVVKEVRNEIY